MIFCSKNEAGEVACELILNGSKTVTRRLKPIAAGKTVAVQPGRGKKAVGYVKVISCVPETEFIDQIHFLAPSEKELEECLLEEANLEGFKSWDGLIAWFSNHKPLIRLDDTFRIEFVYLGEKKS